MDFDINFDFQLVRNPRLLKKLGLLIPDFYRKSKGLGLT